MEFSMGTLFRNESKRMIRGVISIDYILILFLTIAVCMDFWKQIIPNELIYIGSTACILSMVSGRETECFARGLVQIFVLFLCLLPAYLIKAVGAGDVKLFMMIVWFYPKENMLRSVFVAMILGSVIGVIKIICEKIKTGTGQISTNRGRTYARHKIHFSLPIFLSVLLKLMRVY